MTSDEHVKTRGSRAYLEDGTREDYDPETCLVYSEAFAVVRSPACVAEKLDDYFAEDGGYWRPEPSAVAAVALAERTDLRIEPR